MLEIVIPGDTTLGLQHLVLDYNGLSVARPPEPPENIKTEAILESAKERYENPLVSIHAEVTTKA
jgi:hypothetical protein